MNNIVFIYLKVNNSVLYIYLVLFIYFEEVGMFGWKKKM